jgi:chemotaxis protein methyltransferase CheR
MITIDESDELKSILLNKCNIDISYYSKSFIIRRLSFRMNVLNINNYNEYIRMLKSNDKEVKELLKELSINVTEFFRDKEVFDQFADILKGYNSANILSIGCASGEEPYTIAIIAKMNNIKCNITAYDINKDAIEYAKNGRYTYKSVKGTPSNILNTYFDMNNNEYNIKREVKDMVKFEIKDVTKVDFAKQQSIYDFIFCRNMLIYIDNNIKNRLIENICNAIKTGGYFIIGRSESILECSRLQCINFRTKIYKKIN